MKNAKILTFALGCGLMLGALTGCGGGGAASSIKVGLILLHPASSSTYDKNFNDAMKQAQKKLGFKLVVKENVPEEALCQTTAEEMADQGCDVVFADSFGHESYIIEAAKNKPNVTFCHATGNQAATAGVENFHDAFAAIYQGRYLAGVVAGLKMEEDIAAGKYTAEEAKIGYVGAFNYAEVKSGFTSFYLGARSVVPSVTMEVKYTNSWYDETKEKLAAEALIADNCKLISQHADSYGAPGACEAAGIPNVAYNGSTASQCPNTYLVSSKIDWAPYYEYVINAVLKAKQEGTKVEIEKDYVGTFATGGVAITELGKNVAKGTAEKIEAVKADLISGKIHVFDTTKFTIGGAAPSAENCNPSKEWTYDYPDGTDFLKDGYYNESVYRSAPSFDVIIDGITEAGEIK